MDEHDKQVDEHGKFEPKPSDDANEPASSQMSWNQGVIVGGLAISLPGMLFGPPLFGMALDDYLGTSPWFTLGLLILGFIGTVYNVFLILKRVKMLG